MTIGMECGSVPALWHRGGAGSHIAGVIRHSATIGRRSLRRQAALPGELNFCRALVGLPRTSRLRGIGPCDVRADANNLDNKRFRAN